MSKNNNQEKIIKLLKSAIKESEKLNQQINAMHNMLARKTNLRKAA